MVPIHCHDTFAGGVGISGLYHSQLPNVTKHAADMSRGVLMVYGGHYAPGRYQIGEELKPLIWARAYLYFAATSFEHIVAHYWYRSRHSGDDQYQRGWHRYLCWNLLINPHSPADTHGSATSF